MKIVCVNVVLVLAEVSHEVYHLVCRESVVEEMMKIV
jgi:hypothetical protein